MNPEGSPEGREPKLARRSPFERESKLCPKCLSPLRNVTGDLLGIIPPEYHCDKCGYQGPVYVVDDKDLEGTG